MSVNAKFNASKFRPGMDADGAKLACTRVLEGPLWPASALVP